MTQNKSLVDTVITWSSEMVEGTTTITGHLDVNDITFFGWIQMEWILGVVLFLMIAVVVLGVSLYFVRKEVKRIMKFNFLIRDDVAEDVRKVKNKVFNNYVSKGKSEGD